MLVLVLLLFLCCLVEKTTTHAAKIFVVVEKEIHVCWWLLGVTFLTLHDFQLSKRAGGICRRLLSNALNIAFIC